MGAPTARNFMATNLVSEVAEVLSPAIASHIAPRSGLVSPPHRRRCRRYSGLLAALISYVSKLRRDEARRSREETGADAVQLARVIGEPGQKALIDQGASVLTSLVGKTVSTQ